MNRWQIRRSNLYLMTSPFDSVHFNNFCKMLWGTFVDSKIIELIWGFRQSKTAPDSLLWWFLYHNRWWYDQNESNFVYVTFNDVINSRYKFNWNTVYYTPDIRSMWGYIVFAFPFVRSFVRTYVRSFVRSYVRSFRSFVRLSVTGSKFLR